MLSFFCSLGFAFGAANYCSIFFHVFDTAVCNGETIAWHVCFGVVVIVRVMRMKVELGIESLMLPKKKNLGVKKARKIRRRKARGKIRMECSKPRRKLK